MLLKLTFSINYYSFLYSFVFEDWFIFLNSWKLLPPKKKNRAKLSMEILPYDGLWLQSTPTVLMITKSNEDKTWTLVLAKPLIRDAMIRYQASGKHLQHRSTFALTILASKAVHLHQRLKIPLPRRKFPSGNFKSNWRKEISTTDTTRPQMELITTGDVC